jgi:hypothetical protein
MGSAVCATQPDGRRGRWGSITCITVWRAASCPSEIRRGASKGQRRPNDDRGRCHGQARLRDVGLPTHAAVDSEGKPMELLTHGLSAMGRTSTECVAVDSSRAAMLLGVGGRRTLCCHSAAPSTGKPRPLWQGRVGPHMKQQGQGSGATGGAVWEPDRGYEASAH